MNLSGVMWCLPHQTLRLLKGIFLLDFQDILNLMKLTTKTWRFYLGFDSLELSDVFSSQFSQIFANHFVCGDPPFIVFKNRPYPKRKISTLPPRIMVQWKICPSNIKVSFHLGYLNHWTMREKSGGRRKLLVLGGRYRPPIRFVDIHTWYHSSSRPINWAWRESHDFRSANPHA